MPYLLLLKKAARFELSSAANYRSLRWRSMGFKHIVFCTCAVRRGCNVIHYYGEPKLIISAVLLEKTLVGLF